MMATKPKPNYLSQANDAMREVSRALNAIAELRSEIEADPKMKKPDRVKREKTAATLFLDVVVKRRKDYIRLMKQAGEEISRGV